VLNPEILESHDNMPQIIHLLLFTCVNSQAELLASLQKLTEDAIEFSLCRGVYIHKLRMNAQIRGFVV